MELSGKRVLVTGGGRGIGEATGRKLARAGARVAFVDIEGDKARSAAAASGAAHLGVTADVTDSASLESAVEAAVTEFGGLDVVVANAGVASWHTVPRTDIDSWVRTVDVNLTGVFRTVRAALPHIIASKGYVLVVSSLASILPIPGGSSYGASKAGAEAFANALRLEMHPHGVAVGSAHMTVIKTDLVGELAQQSTTASVAFDRLAKVLLGTKTADECADEFVRGIRGRARRIYVPRASVLLQWLRPVLASSPVDVVARVVGTRVLRKVMVDIDGTEASMSDRLRGHTGAPDSALTHRGPTPRRREVSR